MFKTTIINTFSSEDEFDFGNEDSEESKDQSPLEKKIFPFKSPKMIFSFSSKR